MDTVITKDVRNYVSFSPDFDVAMPMQTAETMLGSSSDSSHLIYI
jgi:hypothetical protein